MVKKSNIILGLIGCICLYASISLFWMGWHNVDLVMNRALIALDRNDVEIWTRIEETNSGPVSMIKLYHIGHSQMKTSLLIMFLGSSLFAYSIIRGL